MLVTLYKMCFFYACRYWQLSVSYFANMVLFGKKVCIYLIYNCLFIIQHWLQFMNYPRLFFNPSSAFYCQLFGKFSCLLPHGDYSILTSSLISPSTFLLSLPLSKPTCSLHRETSFSSEILIFVTIFLMIMDLPIFNSLSCINFFCLHACLELLYNPIFWLITKCPSIYLCNASCQKA